MKTLLASVEAAPPIDAAEVVAAALTDALGARDVSFLIADYSGRALIRLSHVRRANLDDEDVNRERSHSVTLAGTPHGRALAEQEVQIVPDFGGFRVFAPVTSRGEAVGVLELLKRQNCPVAASYRVMTPKLPLLFRVMTPELPLLVVVAMILWAIWLPLQFAVAIA